jgi:hypothetical protein
LSSVPSTKKPLQNLKKQNQGGERIKENDGGGEFKYDIFDILEEHL